MNRINTRFAAYVFSIALAVTATACASETDKQEDPASQNSELTEQEKAAAHTQEPGGAITNTGTVQKATQVTETCSACGPLPDPWVKSGPLPDPWRAASGSSGTGAPASDTGTGHK